MATLYKEVQAMVARVAQWRKMTYVVKVSNQPISGSNPNSVMAAMANTMVYADPRNDITNDVVFNLNRMYKATGGTAAKTLARAGGAARHPRRPARAAPGTGAAAPMAELSRAEARHSPQPRPTWPRAGRPDRKRQRARQSARRLRLALSLAAACQRSGRQPGSTDGDDLRPGADAGARTRFAQAGEGKDMRMLTARRPQRTLARATEVRGVGFFHGADVAVRFHPAEPDTGIVFVRTDLPDQPSVPAQSATWFRRSAGRPSSTARPRSR